MKIVSRMAGALAATLLGTAALVGCDQHQIDRLEEGLSTETEVRAQFGEPAYIWPEPQGAHTLEYNRQPMGHQNYMITIGPDGKMQALRQVVVPHVFAQVHPGMTEQQVRRLLGMPAKRMRFALKQETDWDWNWIDPPSREMLFTVTFGDDGRVIRSATLQKPPSGNQ